MYVPLSENAVNFLYLTRPRRFGKDLLYQDEALILLDSLNGSRKGIMHKIADEGYIYASLIPDFPTCNLINPKTF